MAEMQNQGIVPDAVTYQTMIFGCLNTRRFDQALNLILQCLKSYDVAIQKYQKSF